MSENSETKMIYFFDLDGTLLFGDLSWISFKTFLGLKPLNFFWCIVWFCKGGKELVKFQIAETTKIDLKKLNWSQDVFAFAKDLKAKGHHIVLATGTTQKYADQVKEFLKEFIDEAHGSDPTINLTGTNKLHLIQKVAGQSPYCYVGNSSVDLEVWRHCTEAVVAHAPGWVLKKAQQISKVSMVI